MPLEDNDRTRAAVHEAGHALVAASFGVAVTALVIADDGTGGALVWPEEALHAVWVAYGGIMGETAIFGDYEKDRFAGGGQGDEYRAYKIGSEHNIKHLDIKPQVGEFLMAHRAGIEYVATRVLEVGQLEGDELSELLREALALS